MRDPELPARIDSVFALRSFVEACKGGFIVFGSILILINLSKA